MSSPAPFSTDAPDRAPGARTARSGENGTIAVTPVRATPRPSGGARLVEPDGRVPDRARARRRRCCSSGPAASSRSRSRGRVHARAAAEVPPDCGPRPRRLVEHVPSAPWTSRCACRRCGRRATSGTRPTAATGSASRCRATRSRRAARCSAPRSKAPAPTSTSRPRTATSRCSRVHDPEFLDWFSRAWAEWEAAGLVEADRAAPGRALRVRAAAADVGPADARSRPRPGPAAAATRSTR